MGEAPLVCTLLYAKKKCNNRIFMLAFCTVCGTFIVWRITLWLRQMQRCGKRGPRGTVGFDKSFILSIGPDLTQHSAAISKRDTCGTHRPQNFDTTQTHPPKDPASSTTDGNQPRMKKKKQNTTQNGTHESANMCFTFYATFLQPQLVWHLVF